MADSPEQFYIGELVLCGDGEGIWYRAEVQQICELNGKKEYLINYYGWGSEYNEWVPGESLRADNIEHSHDESESDSVSDFTVNSHGDAESLVNSDLRDCSPESCKKPIGIPAERAFTVDGLNAFNTFHSSNCGKQSSYCFKYTPKNINYPHEDVLRLCCECRNVYHSNLLKHMNHLWAALPCNICRNSNFVCQEN